MSFARRFARRHRPIGDTSIRYGGRTIEVRIILNTDRDPNVLCELAKKHLRGPNLDMCVVAVSHFDPVAAAHLWQAVDRKNDQELAAIMDATHDLPTEGPDGN